MRALVIGADGFVGRWLVRHLAEQGDAVHGAVGPRFQPPLPFVESAQQIDVRRCEDVSRVVRAVSPEAIYYLAAISQAGSRENISDAAQIGVVGAIHALVAAAEIGRAVRMVHVSSAHVYQPADSPLPESTPINPQSMYGAAKAASEQAVLTLAARVDVGVVIARPFNHIGPGQRAGFLVPSLASQVRAILPGQTGTLELGDPEMVRDFTDVRDVVRAYRLLATDGVGGEAYNVASGTGTSVRQLAGLMLDIAGASAAIDASRRSDRGPEPPVLMGDAGKLERLGWRRKISLRQSLSDVLGGMPSGSAA